MSTTRRLLGLTETCAAAADTAFPAAAVMESLRRSLTAADYKPSHQPRLPSVATRAGAIALAWMCYGGALGNLVGYSWQQRQVLVAANLC